MANRIRIELDETSVILARRHLNGENSEAQVKFTKLCAKEFNNFVPYDTGYLKDGSVELEAKKVIYNAPYARINYYSNRGNGRQGTSHGGNRGSRWAERCWVQKKDKILNELAEFIGGEVD